MRACTRRRTPTAPCRAGPSRPSLSAGLSAPISATWSSAYITAPITIAVITARGRVGFLASPARWTACSKPWSANTTARQRGEHAVEAERHEPAAGGEVRGLKLTEATTKIARNGTSVFQITTIVLLSDRNFAPARLTAVNTIIRIAATIKPL